jgi:hypothetical protein
MLIRNTFLFLKSRKGRYISVSKVTGYGLDDRESVPGRGRNFSLHHHVQTDCGANTSFCLRGIEGCFRGDKTTETKQ